MKKSILNFGKQLSKSEQLQINGKGAVLTKIGLCSIQYDVCNVAYPSDHDKFVKCMEQKGC